MTLLDSSCIPKAHHLKYIVGNEAQDQISKRLFQENKARQIFKKTNISYHLIRTRTYQAVID